MDDKLSERTLNTEQNTPREIQNVTSWKFRKSKVDPILILDHRRAFLARFWTPQTCLRQPNTTPETKMHNFKFHYFRSQIRVLEIFAHFNRKCNRNRSDNLRGLSKNISSIRWGFVSWKA